VLDLPAMKSRALWLFVLSAALALVTVAWWRNRMASRSAAAPITRAAQPPAKPKPEVPIQDGKTIDFSSGVPVVKDDAKEKAALERSLKEMDEAARNVTFAPSATAPVQDGKKKAEPPPAPPKS